MRIYGKMIFFHPKKIAQLENKLLHEKQFRRQMELRAEIKRLVESGQ